MRFSMDRRSTMTRMLPLLAILGLAVLALAIVLSQFAIPPLRGEDVSGGSSLATSTAELSAQIVLATSATTSVVATPDASVPLNQRPLNLSVLPADDPCPMSKGSRETVPREPYIFCAGCLWFGGGPAYFALSFHDDRSQDATFSLAGVPYEGGTYRAKTPWVSKPGYSGPILVRGRQLDGIGENKLRFSHQGSGPSEELHLGGYGGASSSSWEFWPSSMWLPGPGCYGVQIDTLQGTDVVIFSATGKAPAPGLSPTP